MTDVCSCTASSDTRMHVAESTVDKLIDYCMNTSPDGLTTSASVVTLDRIIDANLPFITDEDR